MAQKIVKPTHKDICQAAAKINAYLNCGDKEKAREWADKMVTYLRQMDLYPRAKVTVPVNKVF